MKKIDQAITALLTGWTLDRNASDFVMRFLVSQPTSDWPGSVNDLIMHIYLVPKAEGKDWHLAVYMGETDPHRGDYDLRRVSCPQRVGDVFDTKHPEALAEVVLAALHKRGAFALMELAMFDWRH